MVSVKTLVVLFLLSILLVVAFADKPTSSGGDNGKGDGKGDDAPQKENSGKSCGRSLTYKARPPGKPTDIRWSSVAACRYGGKPGAAAAVFADINVNGQPDMSIGVFHAGTNKDKRDDDNSSGDDGPSEVDNSVSGFRIILDRVVEYKDVDGVDGYQPGNGDTAYKSGTTKLNNVRWAPFVITSQAVDNATLYTASSTSTQPAYFTLSVQFSDASIKNSNGSIIDPSAFKFNFDLHNYVYSNVNATGIALRLMVISRGSVAPKSSTQTVPTDVDLSNQTTYNVHGPNQALMGTYFAWENEVKSANGSVYVLHNKVGDGGEDGDNSTVPINWQASAIWFSIPHQVTDFSWDPYAMADDSVITSTSTSAAVAVVVELFIVVLAVFALML
jgi:hypothetical protein